MSEDASDVNQILEDEIDEELAYANQLTANLQDVHLAHSVTTDTLDSVLLETSATDDTLLQNEPLQEQTDSSSVNLLNDSNERLLDDTAVANTIEKNESSSKVEVTIGTEAVTITDDNPSLSSYFSTGVGQSLSTNDSSVNFFDTLSEAVPKSVELQIDDQIDDTCQNVSFGDDQGDNYVSIQEETVIPTDMTNSSVFEAFTADSELSPPVQFAVVANLSVSPQGDIIPQSLDDLPDSNVETFHSMGEVEPVPPKTPPVADVTATTPGEKTTDTLFPKLERTKSDPVNASVLLGDSPSHHSSFTETNTSISPEIIPPHTGDSLTFDNLQNSSYDAFTSCINMSDSDRCHDAWIPSDATRHILLTVATSAPGTYIPVPEQLSKPSVISTEPQADPIRDLVNRYMGEQEALRRRTLQADDVSQDANGVRRLIEAECFRAAVDLTGKLLTNKALNPDLEKNIHTPQMLQIWFCRYALLMKLRHYSVAEVEFQGFGSLDTPDLYFEFYPTVYPGRRGSLVPFCMRLLHAELPHFLGRSQESLDRLYYMLAVVQKILKNLENELSEDGSALELSSDSRKVSQELWLKREEQVMNVIANTLLGIKDYEGALEMYEIILEKNPGYRLHLINGLGRIHLQMGNVNKAAEYFDEIEKSTDKGDKAALCRNSVNKGLMSMCLSQFEEALQHFKAATDLDPENTAAVNNTAVCSLYLGNLKSALTALEALVHKHPKKNLYEGVLFNLCTLYELESSRALHKKQALLDLVSKHKGDGFPVACLKMT